MSRSSSPTKSVGDEPHIPAGAAASDPAGAVNYANFDHLKIAVRERPLGDGEAAAVQVVLRTEGDKLIAFYPSSKEGLVYNYDHFYPAESTQSDLFHTVGDEMVSLAMNGFSTTFICTGPSSAGKTHTLFGSDQEAGLVQHVTREIFSHIAAVSDQYEFRVIASYFEVNGDDICDALSHACTATAAAAIGVTAAEAFRSATADLQQQQQQQGTDEMVRLRRDNKFGGYCVCGIREVPIQTWDQLDNLLLKGNNRRIELAEKRRARWHGFVRMTMERTPKLSPTAVSRCVVTFVHTKGPERVGEQGTYGEQMRQGSRLNKSLSLLNSAVLHCSDFRRKALKEAVAAGKDVTSPAVLGDVIDRSASFFMESKFTQLIGQSLTGRCATFMLGCVSSTNYHDATDTLEALQAAQQLTACVPTRVTVTKYGKLQAQLGKTEAKCHATAAVNLAPGHPLSEVEEKVERLRSRLSSQLQQYLAIPGGALSLQDLDGDGDIDEDDLRIMLEQQMANRPPPPPPINVPPHLQKWKQDTLRAKMHGAHATVYIPTKRGPSEYDTYRGDWARGYKDGFGEHITAKCRYVGGWAGGLRDGEGTLWIRDCPSSASSSSSSSSSAAAASATGASSSSSSPPGKSVNSKQALGTMKSTTPQAVLPHKQQPLPAGGTATTASSSPGGGGEEGSVGTEWVRVYKGEWRRGMRHGYGMQWSPSTGETYEGYFEKDQRSAVGKLFLSNGDRIEGQFANGMVHGWATLYCKNNDWFEGRWFEGMREGPGVWHYVTKQQVYKGSWHRNVPKCGVMEDMSNKSTDTTSTFLPRCTLAEPDKVLAQQRAQLEAIRAQLFGVAESFENAPKGPSAGGPARPSANNNQEPINWE